MPSIPRANGPAFHIARKLRSMALLTALPLALFAKATFADKIVLENGDTLSGTVVKLKGGQAHAQDRLRGFDRDRVRQGQIHRDGRAR